MSTELTKRESDEVMSIAKLGNIFYKSGYFSDIRDEAQAIVKVLYGRELNFSPVVSMMGIHVIEGKPSLSSNLLGTLVKRSGKYDYRVKESTDKVCTLEFFALSAKRKESLGLATFTIEDAQRANIKFVTRTNEKTVWAKYPKAMLFARALSAGVRLHCPDVSACPLYVPEELGATVDEEGAVTELPKSARPVETIEQEIHFEKAVGGSVVLNKPNGGLGQAAASSPAPAAPTRTDPRIIEGLERITDKYLGPEKAPTLESLKAKLADLLPTDPLTGLEAVAVPLINDKQASHLRGRFRESLPEDLRDNSETLLHDFLAFHKFIGPDANPHIHLIPETEFKKIGKLAVAHAKSLATGDTIGF